MVEEFKEITALFITLTANSQFHKYKTDEQKNLILNPKYKYNCTPNDRGRIY